MTRSLMLTIMLTLSCLGAATAGYLGGRTSGPDLTAVARAGTSAGAHSGIRAGSNAGEGDGFRAGYRAGYGHTYAGAYRAAYTQIVGR